MEERIPVPGFGEILIRRWRPDDAEALQKHANNRKIWLNLRDLFPYPYTFEDAVRFLDFAAHRETCFAIEIAGEAAGSIGFSIGLDVHRFTAEVGYWLSEAYWGRGIMSAALARACGFMLEKHGLYRIHAEPYEWNPASARVLEKAGFELEGRARRAAFKDGRIVDQLVYARIGPGSE